MRENRWYEYQRLNNTKDVTFPAIVQLTATHHLVWILYNNTNSGVEMRNYHCMEEDTQLNYSTENDIHSSKVRADRQTIVVRGISRDQ
jgi:hypothetical protein